MRDEQSARQAALGSIGAAQYMGTGSITANPAMLAYMQERAYLDLTVGIAQYNEDRFQPLYDTFSSYVTETAYVSNRNSYGMMQGGATIRLVKDLNRLYRGQTCLHQYEFDDRGFQWIDCNDAENSVLVYQRNSGDGFLVVASETAWSCDRVRGMGLLLDFRERVSSRLMRHGRG